MYHILIVGAGYIGEAAARFFAARGQKVHALMRNAERAEALRASGIHAFTADLQDPSTLHSLPDANFIVLAAAPDERSSEAYRGLYLNGNRNFLEAYRRRLPPSLLVYLSSTGVWGRSASGWIDEDSPVEPDHERSRILFEAEKQIFESGYPSVVFRLSGIYGPGRNRIRNVLDGDFPDRNEDVYLNMIHRDDIVEALPVLFNRAEIGRVYLGVDDLPVARSALYAWLCGELGRPVFACREGVSLSGKRCRNRRLKQLGFSLRFPDFRAGYRGILEAEKPA